MVLSASGNRTRVHPFSALGQETGAALSQIGVGIKTNETTQFTTLFDYVVCLNHSAMTAHAIHTRKGYAKYLHASEAHYIFTVKSKQYNLLTGLDQLP